MAGLLDYHVCAVIERAMPLYTGNLARFQALCLAVEPAVSAEWHAALVADPPEIILFGQKSKKEFPVVVVSTPNEEPDQNVPINNFAYRDPADNHEVYQQVGRESLTVEILGRDPQVVRALAIVVRASMMLALDWFVSAGYDSLDWNGNDPLAPEEDWAAEAMGITVRRIRYSAMSTLSVKQPDNPLTSKPWYVGAADQSFDGNPGGVVPYDPDQGG